VAACAPSNFGETSAARARSEPARTRLPGPPGPGPMAAGPRGKARARLPWGESRMARGLRRVGEISFGRSSRPSTAIAQSANADGGHADLDSRGDVEGSGVSGGRGCQDWYSHLARCERVRSSAPRDLLHALIMAESTGTGRSWHTGPPALGSHAARPRGKAREWCSWARTSEATTLAAMRRLRGAAVTGDSD